MRTYTHALTGYLVASLILVTRPALADLAIYNLTSKSSSVGNYAVGTTAQTGIFVLDLVTNKGTSISVFKTVANGTTSVFFSETEMEADVIAPVTGPRGASYTLIAQADSPQESPSPGGNAATQLIYQSVFGLNSLLQVRPNAPARLLPKKMTSPSFVVGKDFSGNHYVQQGTTSYLFASSYSMYANQENWSVADVVSYARNILLSQGIPEK
jgi:hypothetical protein